jgi:hypothetical protein
MKALPSMDTQLRALKRLLKKLSAMRQVLANDEREWLDRFVIRQVLQAQPEVQAHGLKSRLGDGTPLVIKFDPDSSTYQLERKPI